MKKRILPVVAVLAIIGFNLSIVQSAQAAVVRLEVPQPIMNLWKKIHTEKANAQENTAISPEPATQTTIQPISTPPAIITPIISPEPPKDSSSIAPMPKPPLDNFTEQKPPENIMNQQQPQPPQMDFNQPPKQQPPQGEFNKPFSGDNKPFDNQNPNKGQGMQGGKDDERAVRDFKRGAKQMESMIKSFEKRMNQAEKSGGVVSEEIKNKISQAKQLLEKINSAKTTDEMGNNTMEELQEVMNDLQQNGQEVLEKIQRLAGIKRELRNMERGFSMFEKQVAKLTKQGVTIPTKVNENLQQLKKIIDTVKNAKSWDEIESVGLENMGDLMQELGESRGQLEMLARWPQTQKQIDRELTNLNRTLKRDKALVEKLNKQGVDLNENYQKIVDAIASAKSARDQAIERMKAGESQEAFELLENDFFDKMDDLREEQRVFDTLGNLGRFNTDFKKEMALAKRNIDRLAKSGEDTTDLKELLAQANEKGTELLGMLKSKPVDIEAVTDALEELSGIRQSFQNNMQELSGGEDLPWEQGPKQFQDLKVSPGFNKFIKPTSQSTTIEQ